MQSEPETCSLITDSENEIISQLHNSTVVEWLAHNHSPKKGEIIALISVPRTLLQRRDNRCKFLSAVYNFKTRLTLNKPSNLDITRYTSMLLNV